MSRKNFATALPFSLILIFFVTAFAQDSEKSVKMKDLPEAVQKTVREQSAGATIRGFSKEVEGGKTFYEVEMRANGRNKDVLIDPSGAVVSIEEEVSIDSVPSAVKAGIEKHAAGGKIHMVESITENGAIIAYEAHIKTGNKYLEVKLGPDGALIESESDNEDEDDDREPARTQKGSKNTKKPWPPSV